jgi:hypothetical protein
MGMGMGFVHMERKAWVRRWVGGITNESMAAWAFGTNWDTQYFAGLFG